VLSNEPVEVAAGAAIIEVKPQGVSKGGIVERILTDLSRRVAGWLVCRDWLGRCNCTRVCPCRYASEVRREGVRSLLVTETLVMEEAIRRRRPAPWHVW